MKPLKFDLTQFPAAIRHKWPGSVLDEGFTPVPKRLVRCLGRVFKGAAALEHLAVVLAVVDHRRLGSESKRGVPLARLALTAGLAPEVFLKRLEELKAEGLATSKGDDQAIVVKFKGLFTRIKSETSGKA